MPEPVRYNSFQSLVINPRKLAAIDIVFLGSKLIIAEFAGRALLCAALGTFMLFRVHSFWKLILGRSFISLGIKYGFTNLRNAFDPCHGSIRIT